MDSGQNPVVPLLGVDLVRERTVHVDLNEPANQKVREPTRHFSG